MVAVEHRLLQVCAHTLTCLPWSHACASLRTSPFDLSPSLPSLLSLLVVPLLLAWALYEFWWKHRSWGQIARFQLLSDHFPSESVSSCLGLWRGITWKQEQKPPQGLLSRFMKYSSWQMSMFSSQLLLLITFFAQCFIWLWLSALLWHSPARFCNAPLIQGSCKLFFPENLWHPLLVTDSSKLFSWSGKRSERLFLSSEHIL